MQDTMAQQGWTFCQKCPGAVVLWVQNRDHAENLGAC